MHLHRIFVLNYAELIEPYLSMILQTASNGMLNVGKIDKWSI